MSASGTLTLSKEERICSRKLIDKLFNREGSRSMAAFPLRLVYTDTERAEGEPPVKILVSVPKRHFKHAVKRNRVKRQVREAYRHNKNILCDKVIKQENTALAIAFIWLDDKLWATNDVEAKVRNLLQRLAEKKLRQ